VTVDGTFFIILAIWPCWIIVLKRPLLFILNYRSDIWIIFCCVFEEIHAALVFGGSLCV